MIRIENVSKSFPDGELFANVNISIKAGMRTGLVGPNGSGKTTLLRIMLGQESPDSGTVQKDRSTTIGYLAQDIIAGSGKSILEEVLSGYPEVKEIELKMQFLSKEISENPNKSSLAIEFGEAQDRYESLGGWKLEDRAKKILSGLGFKKEKFKDPMDVFSGGWRMRVALAGILLQEPDILFLDEPTNHLDLEATIWLESFLSAWKGSLIMISHDREFLDRSINHIIEIDRKKMILYKGNYTLYKEEKELRLEQLKNAYKNQQKQIKDTERFIERFRSKNTKATQVQSRVKKLEKLEIIEPPKQDGKVINLVLPQPSRSPLNVVSCTSVQKSYEDLKVFNEMDFIVERGNKIGLVGNNGAGKSTLLKMLAGEEEPTKGKVTLGNGVEREYYAQHQLEILDKNDSVYETIVKVSGDWSETKIRTYLGNFLFIGEEIEKRVKVLSGGEKARLAMARMLVDPTHLLLLDEPTNHLDMASRNVVENALINYKGSLICISHDRHFLNKVTNLICEVGNGGIKMYEGNYDYFEWKKLKKEEIKPLSINDNLTPVKKETYREKKKKRNRLSWIKKRYNTIETLLEEQRSIHHDPKNCDNYKALQDAMEALSNLEKEYLDLMQEEELLLDVEN